MNLYANLFNKELIENNFQLLELEEKSPENKDCVFLWVYTKQSRPYKKYEDPLDTLKTMCLTQLRWDGSFGAPGGKVDQRETLQQALFREVYEETGLEFSFSEKQAVSPLSSIKMQGSHIHAYCLEVSFERISDLFSKANQHLAQSQKTPQGIEVAGICLAHLCAYKTDEKMNPRGADLFLQNKFAATAKAEILQLLQRVSST